MLAALLDEEHAELLERIDVGCLWFFAGELLVRVYRARLGFFRSPWCCADAAIIVLALAPVAGGGIAVLRMARLARSFHLLKHLAHARLWRLLRLWGGSGIAPQSREAPLQRRRRNPPGP
jgi:hypothetical protein